MTPLKRVRDGMLKELPSPLVKDAGNKSENLYYPQLWNSAAFTNSPLL
jgi:hypothetical protein